MGILAEIKSLNDKWHCLMPKPFLKVFHIIIPRDCRTDAAIALNVKGHLDTFRHGVCGESYSTHIIPLEERKTESSRNCNPLKPQAAVKSLNAFQS